MTQRENDDYVRLDTEGEREKESKSENASAINRLAIMIISIDRASVLYGDAEERMCAPQ